MMRIEDIDQTSACSRRWSCCSAARMVRWAARIAARWLGEGDPVAATQGRLGGSEDGDAASTSCSSGRAAAREAPAEAVPQRPRGLGRAARGGARAQEVALQRVDQVVVHGAGPQRLVEVGRHPRDVLAEVVLEHGDLLAEFGGHRCCRPWPEAGRIPQLSRGGKRLQTTCDG
jgi:hypothetical protein